MSFSSTNYNKYIGLLILVHVLIAVAVTYYLLGPGFWGGDALNGYIQSVTKEYSSTQPVFLAFVCSLTNHIIAGAQPVLLIFSFLYFLGLALFIFMHIANRFIASMLFFLVGFWPPLYSHIGVIQTEEMQLAILSITIPLVILLYRYQGRFRWVIFAASVILLCCFWLVRYDSIFISIILIYWLGFSLFRKNSVRILLLTGVLAISFSLTGIILDESLHFNTVCKQEMRNALMIADLASISVESKVNYVPEYCWQPYISQNDKTIKKMEVGKQWELSYFSFLFNIDPSVGLFKYNTSQYTADLRSTWLKTILMHPFFYCRFHLKYFICFLLGVHFEASLYDGIHISQINNSRLTIEKSNAVDRFLEKNKDRFMYSDGGIVYYNDDRPITDQQASDLLSLIDERRISDVKWMRHFSQIQSKVYTARSEMAEQYVLPFFYLFERWFKPLCCLITYFIIAILGLIFFRQKIKDDYSRLSFIVLICCGTVNILQHFFIATDPIFRFGVISILFWFFGGLILMSRHYRPNTYI